MAATIENFQSLLDDLCDCFDDEAERQETLLSVCRAQGEAARVPDVGGLETRTAAITLLLQETAAAEKRRIALLREVVGAFGLPAERQTLSELILVTPEPWRSRMAEFQRRICRTLHETRKVVRENRFVLRRGMDVVAQVLDQVTRTSPGDNGYKASGDAARRGGRGPALLDQRG